MAYEYLRDTMGKHFSIGQRIKHQRMGTGEVKPETSAINMVMVLIDGMSFPIPCDPWDLETEGNKS